MYQRQNAGYTVISILLKQKNSFRTIPMLGFVKEAFLMEKAYQEKHNIKCVETIDGYTDFIFVKEIDKTQKHPKGCFSFFICNAIIV